MNQVADILGTTVAVLITFSQVSGLKRRSWPVGRVLSPSGLAAGRGATIHLRPPLPAASCGLPTYSGGPPSDARAPVALTSLPGPRLLDLAPGGVCRAGRVAPVAGGLLHHRFTLTGPNRSPCRRSVLCGTFPRVTPGGCCPPPCPAEPGPSSTHASRRTARSPGQLLRTGKGSGIGVCEARRWRPRTSSTERNQDAGPDHPPRGDRARRRQWMRISSGSAPCRR